MKNQINSLITTKKVDISSFFKTMLRHGKLLVVVIIIIIIIIICIW